MATGIEKADLGRFPDDPLHKHVLDAPDQLFDLLPVAAYVCAADGRIVRFNRRAAELWGRSPEVGDPAERFCGSHRLYRLDGVLLAHSKCPMADVLRTGIAVRDREVLIERPGGSRVLVLVNIDPLRDGAGKVVGAINCFHDTAERNRVEEEIRKSHQDLDDFFENAAVALHWISSDGTILRANQAELDLLGYTREEYVGRNIAEFHADRATVEGILLRLSRGETLDNHPATLRAKDGSARHVLITSGARIQAGEFAGTRCATLDVTAQQSAEAHWRASERRFHALVEALPVAFYTTDADGRLTFYNDAAADLWGHRPDLGKSEWCGSWRLYWPDGRPMRHDECPMAVALKEGRPIRGAEAVAERPDGARVPFLAFPTPLRDDSGALTGAVNTLVDITERKEAERATQWLASIVESSGDAILSKNLDGVIESWNRGAQRLFGYMAEEAIGESVTLLIPPDQQDEEPSILARIRRGERIEHYETVRRRKDGSLVDISLTVSPVKDSKGRIIGASKIARDITERKRAERHQDLLLAELNHRVKNMLAVVAAIAAQTARASGSIEEFREAFSGRLDALARTYTLLTARQWQAAPLAEIVEDAFQPHLDSGGKRIRIAGPDLTVRPRAALTLGMILHELVTNASKYGALSVDEGRISIEWQVVTDQHGSGEVRIRWHEDGMFGLRPPARSGFGTWLIRTSARHELGGTVDFRYHPDGLECDLRFQSERLRDQDD